MAVAAALREKFYTPGEYLALERKAERKHEYFNGRIYAMAGTSRQHARVTVNATHRLGNQLERGECEVYNSDIRVLVAPTGLYTYPDVSVACNAQFADSEFDVLTNPIVLIEVLSKSTEAYDRGTKSSHYRSIESLQEYLLIAQDQVNVEHYVRGDKLWTVFDYNSLDDTIELKSIGCRLLLNELYARVEFPPKLELRAELAE